MSNSGRCKMWFGTRESMRWIDVPLSGADSSPEAWGADGTTLNGMGWAANSRGSNKVYQYEWAQSSSRRDAQVMKSYFEGSFGRGLIYFIDPLAYDTNILPGRWADPSVTVGFEGPSLVYGVDATTSPASPTPNDYPMSTTTYNLTGVAAGFRGEKHALYVPVPEGYTLILGAAYSSTGSGGIFAAPAYPAGVGTPTKLTQLDPMGTELVKDKFTGVLGVWLWIGREDTSSASVSVRGMTARLVRDEEYVPPQNFTNYFINPRMATPQSGDANQVKGFYVNPGSTNPPTAKRSSVWSSGSDYSMELVPNPAAPDGSETVTYIQADALGTTPKYLFPGKTYTIVATIHLEAPQAVSGASSRLISVFDYVNAPATAQAPNEAGTHTVRLVVTIDPSSPQVLFGISGGNAPGDSNIFVGDLTIVEGIYAGAPFSGATPSRGFYSYSWLGTPDDSPSLFEAVSAAFSRATSGPWIGGQGHSGCLFTRPPTYVEYNGRGGGQVGYAATFREVGDGQLGMPGAPTGGGSPAGSPKVAYGYGAPPEDLNVGLYLDVSPANPVMYMPPGSEV